MPSKFPCLGQKKLKYNATYPCSKGFLQSFIKLRSHKPLAESQQAENHGKIGLGENPRFPKIGLEFEISCT